MNIQSIAVLVLIGIAAVFAVRACFKNKGGSCCSGDCSHCIAGCEDSRYKDNKQK